VCVGFVGVEQGECIVSAGGVGKFFLQVFIDGTSLVISWAVSITEDTPNSARSFFARALARLMVACTFHASWFEVANILGMPIPLTVGTLGNITCVPWLFEADFALLQIFHMKYFRVVWGRL
jgi:hypothetical protein